MCDDRYVTKCTNTVNTGHYQPFKQHDETIVYLNIKLRTIKRPHYQFGEQLSTFKYVINY